MREVIRVSNGNMYVHVCIPLYELSDYERLQVFMLIVFCYLFVTCWVGEGGACPKVKCTLASKLYTKRHR